MKNHGVSTEYLPVWPLKTNIESLETATGKLQQVGGESPKYSTCSHLFSCWFGPGGGDPGWGDEYEFDVREIRHMSLRRALPS